MRKWRKAEVPPAHREAAKVSLPAIAAAIVGGYAVIYAGILACNRLLLSGSTAKAVGLAVALVAGTATAAALSAAGQALAEKIRRRRAGVPDHETTPETTQTGIQNPEGNTR